MDTQHLKTLAVLAKTLNYQTASEELSYSPSTLLRQIRQLEAEVGAPLFLREGRSLRLTSAGEAFLPFAEHILEESQLALRTVAKQAEDAAPIQLGGCEMILGYGLSSMLHRFALSYPQYHLYETRTSNENAATFLRKGITEIALYYAMEEKPVPGVYADFLFQEPLHWMAHETHPFHQRRSLHYTDFSETPLLFPHADCCFVMEALRRLRRSGIREERAAFLGSIPLILARAREERALMLVPHSASSFIAEQGNMHIIDVDEEPIRVWNVAIHPSPERMSVGASVLLESIKRQCKRRAMDESVGGVGLPLKGTP